MVCHFLTIEHILSRVSDIPWKLRMQFLPCTSSQTSLNLRKLVPSSFKSAWLQSNTRPLRPSAATLLPMVRVTRVLPTCRTLNIDGLDVIPVLLGEWVDDLL